jgi:TfoX/Sxy family transcriptional regulator of competence genes
MAWRKSPPALVDLFERAVPRSRGVERRKMFGYPAAFLNGHLFAGLHQESFVVRLPEADRERAGVEHQARAFEPMPGRQMREYVVVPAPVLNDSRTLAAWLARSVRYARSLPPKRPRSPRRDGTPHRGRPAGSSRGARRATSQ